MNELAKPAATIEDFPPKLRKLGLFMINSGQLMSIKDACEAIGMNYQAARDQILRQKKKGFDFHKLVGEFVIEKLRNARPEVYKALREGAINGSASHQKLFAQLAGDLDEKPDITINQYTANLSLPQELPSDLLEQRLKDKEPVDPIDDLDSET